MSNWLDPVREEYSKYEQEQAEVIEQFGSIKKWRNVVHRGQLREVLEQIVGPFPENADRGAWEDTSWVIDGYIFRVKGKEVHPVTGKMLSFRLHVLPDLPYFRADINRVGVSPGVWISWRDFDPDDVEHVFNPIAMKTVLGMCLEECAEIREWAESQDV